MRVAINLATQPYEDTRRFYARWRQTLGGVAIVVGLLVFYAAHTWIGARSAAHDLASLRQQQQSVEEQRRRAEQILNRPENRNVRDTSQLINKLIAQKAFSWTLIFSDLEKIMPARVRVVSINPELKDQQLRLDLTVEGGSHDSAVVLLRRMEESRHFRDPRLNSESLKAQSGQNAPPVVAFDISAVYLPELPGAKVPATDQGGGR